MFQIDCLLCLNILKKSDDGIVATNRCSDLLLVNLMKEGWQVLVDLPNNQMTLCLVSFQHFGYITTNFLSHVETRNALAGILYKPQNLRKHFITSGNLFCLFISKIIFLNIAGPAVIAAEQFAQGTKKQEEEVCFLFHPLLRIQESNEFQVQHLHNCQLS